MKRAAIIVAVLLAVAAIVAVAVPFVISSDFLKQRIVHRIARITGRAVTLSGEPTLAIYPHFAVTVDGLTIANPPGMGSDPFIAAESLRTRLRLLPLLLGRTEFDGFELVKPTIHLAVDDRGRPNWLMRDVAAIVPSGGAAPNAPAADPELGEIQISDGTVLYDDLVSNTREQMTAVGLDIVWPDAAAPIGGRGTMQWRGETIEFTGMAATPMALLGGGESAVHFAIGSTPLRLSFNGKASTVAAPRLEGDATASTPSLRRAIEWLGTPMGAGSILGAASVEGTVTIAGRSIAFDKAKIELDGNSAEGRLGVDFAGPRPSVDGTLAVGTLDLSAYIEAIRADLTADAAWLIAPARLPFAEAIDADLRLSAGEVAAGAIRVGRAAATVLVRDGQVDVALGDAHFEGGTFSAHLKAGGDGEALAATLAARFTAMPAQAALAAVAGVSALGGTADLSLDVAGRGRSWAEFAHSVAGPGKVDLTDGLLTGFNLTNVAAALTDPLAAPIAAGGDTTVFSKLEATFAVAGGEFRTDDLTMEGKDFRLSLAGDGSALSGGVKAAGRVATDGADVQIVVGGTWRAPTIARAAAAPNGG